MFYRLRNHLAYRHFQYKTRRMRSSPPVACDPTAGCEVHTMLGLRDLPLYLIAIKSLLRFYDRLAVVIHSDGTLDALTLALLEHHVPGCRIVAADEADAYAREHIAAGSLLERWRAHDPCYRRLIDTELFSRTPKRIILDSDILVLRHPDEVVSWVETGDRPFLMGQPPLASESRPEVKAGDNVQNQFRAQLETLSTKVGLPAEFMQGGTGGFHGAVGDELSLPRIERVLQACLDLNLPMQQWGSDQCLIIYLLSTAGALRLSTEDYLNYTPERVPHPEQATLLHFYGTHRFYQGIYQTLAADMIGDLFRRVRQPVSV